MNLRRKTAALLLTASSLSANPVREAREALEHGFPQVALVKIEAAVPDLGKSGSPAADCLLYARALLESNQPQAALEFLSRCEVDLGPEGIFWRAQAGAANGDWAGALDAYSRCAADTAFEFHRESIIGRARMMQNLDLIDEAIATLETAASWPASDARTTALHQFAGLLLDRNSTVRARDILAQATAATPGQKTRHDFLLARAAMLDGDTEQALGLLAPLVPLDPAMATESTLLHATALERAGRMSEAENLLEEFIAANPDAPGLKRVFVALDKAYAGAASASSSELRRWSGEPEPTLRRKLATYHLAAFESRNNNPRAAMALLEKLSAEPGNNPLAEETQLELAALRLRLDLPEETLSLLPASGGPSGADFLRGLALARTGRFAEAGSAFRLAAQNPTMAESALYNLALCGMLSNPPVPDAAAPLESRFPKSPFLPVLKLQEAFRLARNGDPRAGDTLNTLADSGATSVAAKARLALAEWKFQQLDREGAGLELEKISTRSEMPRQAAVRVFLADTGDPGSEEAAIEEARAFLQAHPDTEPEPGVRMKLGELLYRKGDFASARVELEALARKFPGGDNETPALFLAAKSAARIPSPKSAADAMLLFEEVASKPGPLAHRARLEQAAIQAAQGRPLEANAILDKVLASSPEPDMKAAALIEKGKNLYSLGNSDPSAYKSAIAVWNQIALEAPDPTWRNQAMVRIGTAQEKSGDLNAALASYYEVFKPSANAPTEFFWFHKAGFAAAAILEARKDWPEAIRVYELMAATEGPRALEARNRIRQIRLENFIWDGE